MYSSEDLERVLLSVPNGGFSFEHCSYSLYENPIDNNLAERTIRKLTAQRNNLLYYGNDAGVEMAASYHHSVIGTVKLHGSSIWNVIGTFSQIFLMGVRTMLTWFLIDSFG